MTGPTETLARYAADLVYGDLPPDVPVRATHLAIDLVGSIVRAGHEADSTPSILGMLKIGRAHV